MKIPEKAPDWINFLTDKSNDITSFINNSDFRDLLQKANSEYVYWDRFKYYDIPEGIDQKIAWGALKFNRYTQYKKCAVKDKKNEQFVYLLQNTILRDLHFIDKNAGGKILVDDVNVGLDTEKYLVSSLMEEAIASSQLEGAATTRKKAKEMLREGRKPRGKAEKMVINNYIAIKKVKEYLDQDLSISMIKDMQILITKDTLEKDQAPGEFRDEKEEYVVKDDQGILLFVPPNYIEIEDRLKELCAFVNKEDSEDSEDFIHPVIKAIILHFWLAYIHPFPDGNGRTARTLFYWYILKKGYWMFENLTISRIILKAPAQYARAYLYSEMDDNDLTYFIVFNLKVIKLAMESLNNYIVKQQKEYRKTKSFLSRYPGLSFRQQDILNHALQHPDISYSIQYYKNRYNCAYETARSDLLDLHLKGLFEKIHKKKSYHFVPVGNIDVKLRVIE
ncbi:MAG: Fic family protein [Candidatus Zapsychrus exili]|nr:Fic family protein [Candidatus Zapsychrus exili]